jgi:peptide/nickel transport system permease protein
MSAGTHVSLGGTNGFRPLDRIAWLLHTREGLIGLALLIVVLGLALVGPLVAPHPLAQPIGIPGSGPSGAAPLGTDFLGRDVLSRVLHGGLPVIWLSLLSISLTYLVGISIGMTAGLSRSLVDPILMRAVDLFLVFPPLLLLLVLLSGAGSSTGVLTIGIVVVLFPGVARLVRTATLEVSTTPYVEAAVARGESRFAIMRREILPNIAQSILADLGVRFSGAVILAASVNFLGLGSQPPAANWGLMISENREYLAANPWAVLVPAVLLSGLTVAVNLLSDAYIKHQRRGARR